MHEQIKSKSSTGLPLGYVHVKTIFLRAKTSDLGSHTDHNYPLNPSKIPISEGRINAPPLYHLDSCTCPRLTF